MERRIVTDITSVFFLALALFATFAILGAVCYLQKDNANSMHSIQHAILAYGGSFVFAYTSKLTHRQFNLNRQVNINCPIKNNAKILVFQGRGAVRNLAIFHILVAAGPLSIGEIQRRLNRISGLEVTYYVSLNKRIHGLVRGGYVGEVKPGMNRVGSCKVGLYELRRLQR